MIARQEASRLCPQLVCVLGSIVVTIGLLTGCQEPPAAMPGKGSWRLINYWAIWCAPCREEIPQLNLVNQWPQVQVLGVNYDNKPAVIRAQEREALGITFTGLEYDPTQTLGLNRPQVLPTTVLLDPDGRVIEVLVGPQTTASLAISLRAAGWEGTNVAAEP